MNKNKFPCKQSLPVWIAQDACRENQYAEFRQNFWANGKNAKLVIGCDSKAAIYLNDQLVGLFLSGGTEHIRWYESFELENYLNQEENELKILVYHQGMSASNYTAGNPYIRFGVEVLGENEETEWIAVSGENTYGRRNKKYQNGPVEKNQMGFVWHYDETIPEEEWAKAECLEMPEMEFHMRPIKRQVLKERQKTSVCEHGYLEAERGQEFCKEPLCPIPLHEEPAVGRPFYMLVDCGEECTGFMELELWTETDVDIQIGWGEHLADKRVRTHIGERHFETSYACHPGKNIFTHYFHRLGLRYLELHIYPAEQKPVELVYAGIRPLEYPVEEKGRLQIQDSLHQKIYDIAVCTLKLCMHEHYEDCPWREQALYAMDSLNQALCGYYCFEEYQFARASLELLGESLQPDGYLELHPPGKNAVMIPYFTFMWVIGMKDYLRYSKDEAFIKKHWDKLRQIVDKRLEECQDGLLRTQTSIAYWNFYEWNDLLSGEPIYREEALEDRMDAPYIMSFLLMLDAVRTMSGMLGEEAYEKKLSEIAVRMQKECHRLFWDESEQAYLTYAYKKDGLFVAKEGEFSELVQAWAVLSGVAGENIKENLLEQLAKGNEKWVPCTLSMIRFKYEALLQYPEAYGETVFQDILRIWGNMVNAGATSFWETEDGEAAFEGAGSLCHGWSAMPVYFYHVYLPEVYPELIKDE